jgi:hypothetical protein
MDVAQLLFLTIGAVGTLSAACVLLGERRWHRRFVDLRSLLLIAAVLWVPATIDLIVRQELVTGQQFSDQVTGGWLDRFMPSTTTISSRTTITTTP